MENKTCGNCKRYRPLDKLCDILLSIRDIEKNNKGCRFFDALPKMTNGDRISSMDNAEKAEFFGLTLKVCPPIKGRKSTLCPDGCKQCWLEWLNSEVAE